MYARRASKFRKAPAVQPGQILFHDLYSAHPGSTFFTSITPSIRGDSYLTAPNSENNLPLETDPGGVWGQSGITTPQGRGVEFIPDVLFQWGTGFQGIALRLWASSSGATDASFCITGVRQTGAADRYSNDGLRFWFRNDSGSNQISINVQSRDSSSTLWESGFLSRAHPGTSSFWVRFESEVTGVNTARIACGYSDGPTYPPTVNDWDFIVPVTNNVDIVDDSATRIIHSKRPLDFPGALRIYESKIDSLRELGV